MKTAVTQILGRLISGVLVKHSRKGDYSPSSMLMLTFDGHQTAYEFYSSAGQIKPWELYSEGIGIKDTHERAAFLRDFLAKWGGDQFRLEWLIRLDERGQPQAENQQFD